MPFVARVLLLLPLPAFIAGTLINRPINTEAKVNTSTYLNCSTSISTEHIRWYHGHKYVYVGDEIVEPYLGRFDVETILSTGAYNLVIRSVRPEDAGEYTCIDDGGIGESCSAQLIVLETDDDPSCYLIRHDEPRDVHFMCTITCRGSGPPVLEWNWIGVDRTALEEESILVNAADSANCTFVVKPSIEFQAEPFACEKMRSAKNQYTCTVILSDESSSAKASTTISLLSIVAVGYIMSTTHSLRNNGRL